MFLHKLGSSDRNFKALTFHEGMNILLADKTNNSRLGDSRNGAGKTSFIRILRYLLGGNLHGSLKSKELENHSFWVYLELNETNADYLERPIKPQTKVIFNGKTITVEDWKSYIRKIFDTSDKFSRPTVSQLVSQLVRDNFDDPLKIFTVEPSWESGARIGYLLGLSPEILIKAGRISALKKHQKSLKKAISDGTLGMHPITLKESELRSQLAQKKRQRTRIKEDLSKFRVDDQYVEHQAEADHITQMIKDLNDRALVLEQRKKNLETTMREEVSSNSNNDVKKQLETMYTEVGIAIPDLVIQRFDEVLKFHMSIIRNRKMFLNSELISVTDQLERIHSERKELDQRRATVMNLLNDSMALETFRNAEQDLTALDSTILSIEKNLETVQSLSDTGLRLRSMEAEAEASVRAEMSEQDSILTEAITLFQQLGAEIYDDRDVSLLIEATNDGTLKFIPKIDGDASAGILGVKIFLLDIVCLIMAIKANRAPRLLVHDSQLFDSMDDRQVASCLNIGARLADEYKFQYVVTLNSDRLIAAEEEGFERRDYVIDPVLTDVGEDGGLFGFRFK